MEGWKGEGFHRSIEGPLFNRTQGRIRSERTLRRSAHCSGLAGGSAHFSIGLARGLRSLKGPQGGSARRRGLLWEESRSQNRTHREGSLSHKDSLRGGPRSL
jgi:hypothetical protein